MLKKITSLIALASLISLAALYLAPQEVRGAGKGDAKASLEVYKANCLRCHGDKGKGDGPAAKLLKTKPADWTDKARMSKLTEKDLVTVITKGGGAVGKSPVMPAFGEKLKGQDVQNLIALMAQMGSAP